MKNSINLQKGFSLIELMIVIAIIGILASIAVPAYSDYIKRSKVSEIITYAGSIKTAISSHRQEAGNFGGTLTAMGAPTENSDFINSMNYAQPASAAGPVSFALCSTVDDSTINLIFTGTIVDGAFDWGCAVSDGNAAASADDVLRFVPAVCRTKAAADPC